MQQLKTIISCLFLLSLTCIAQQKPQLQHANVLKTPVELTHYWVSEKLDGVRAYWDGKKLVTRNGNPIYSPSWFTHNFPATPLDGELWIARGKFEQTLSTVSKITPVDKEWRHIKFMVFDLPSHRNTPFHSRQNTLKKLLVTTGITHLRWVTQFKLDSQQQLDEKLEQVTQSGGEGLMLHHTSAHYRAGRSHHLLKLKPHLDMEATVVKILPGKGKFIGLMGALEVKLDDGKVFKIGSGFNRQDRTNPPALGQRITFKYHGFTKNGIPKFASYLRPRTEL